MFNIRNYDDLRLAYMILELDAEHGERRKEYADNLKREMRKFCGDYEMAEILREQIDELQEELYNYEQMNMED